MATNQHIIDLLNEILDGVKQDKISEEKLKTLNEFFFAWKFEFPDKDDSADGDIYKYITLGHYIYTYILN